MPIIIKKKVNSIRGKALKKRIQPQKLTGSQSINIKIDLSKKKQVAQPTKEMDNRRVLKPPSPQQIFVPFQQQTQPQTDLSSILNFVTRMSIPKQYSEVKVPHVTEIKSTNVSSTSFEQPNLAEQINSINKNNELEKSILPSSDNFTTISDQLYIKYLEKNLSRYESKDYKEMKRKETLRQKKEKKRETELQQLYEQPNIYKEEEHNLESSSQPFFEAIPQNEYSILQEGTQEYNLKDLRKMNIDELQQLAVDNNILFSTEKEIRKGKNKGNYEIKYKSKNQLIKELQQKLGL